MNAQERLRRKRRKQLYRRLRLLIPIAVIVLLIAGLTAGGIILSLNQTKRGTASRTGGSDTKQSDESQQNQEERQSGEDGSDQTGESAEGEGESSSAEENESEPNEENAFEELLAEIRAGLAADSSYLTLSNPAFETIRQGLAAIDTSLLDEKETDLYQVLLDQLTVEEEGLAYKDNVPEAGQRMCDVEGGVAYYEYLLKKLTGTDYGMTELHDKLANELNSMFEVVSGLLLADPTIAQTVTDQNATKSGANSGYLFSTVTAVSDDLQVSLACEGLTNGWGEFGLIRAYLQDESLTESVRNYLVNSTRMTYAMYGLLDYYVHHDGWNEAQVTELCNNYFGGGQESFAASMYQNILNNPGRFVAAGLGYQELVSIESTLFQNTPDYTEQSLLDFLFDRGPASFRVYWSWLENAAE